jgi:hypothetical protein
MVATAGNFFDPFHGQTVSYQVAGPVVDLLRFVEKGRDEFTLSGVLGNRAHWMKKRAGDHTSRSTHSIFGVMPKSGWIYAIDISMRDATASRLERYMLTHLRAGRYKEVKYFNILNRHWHRQNGFRSAESSGDHHLHVSIMPDYERSHSTLLSNFTSGKAPAGAALPPPVIRGVRRLFDPGRVDGTEMSKIVDEKGHVLASDLALAPVSVLVNKTLGGKPNLLYAPLVPGFGGPQSKVQAEIVELIAWIISTGSLHWGKKFNRDAVLTARELDSVGLGVLRDLTVKAGGAWDPFHPRDTFVMLGFTDQWRKPTPS